MLADCMVSNLLYNAIRYTPEKGKIRVETGVNFFKIMNDGEEFRSSGEELFIRFYKENSDSSSLGLGLAIVKQIAQSNRNHINYKFENKYHIFEYLF